MMPCLKKNVKLYDLLAFLLVLAGLAGGLLLQGSGCKAVGWQGGTITLPAGIRAVPRESGQVLQLSPLFSRSPNYPDRIRVERLALDTTVSNAADPGHSWRQRQFGSYRLYREIDGTVRQNGENWVQFEYAYVVDPDNGSPGQDARPPVVVQGVTRLYRQPGGKYIDIFTYSSDTLDYLVNLPRVIAVFDSYQYH